MKSMVLITTLCCVELDAERCSWQAEIEFACDKYDSCFEIALHPFEFFAPESTLNRPNRKEKPPVPPLASHVGPAPNAAAV